MLSLKNARISQSSHFQPKFSYRYGLANESYPNEWDHQNKAINTLNQLENKGLCHSIKTNMPKLGDVRLFKPPV